MLLQLLRDTHKEKRDTHKGPSGHRPVAAETVLAVVPGSNAAAAAAQRFTLTPTAAASELGSGPRRVLDSSSKHITADSTERKGGLGPPLPQHHTLLLLLLPENVSTQTLPGASNPNPTSDKQPQPLHHTQQQHILPPLLLTSPHPHGLRNPAF